MPKGKSNSGLYVPGQHFERPQPRRACRRISGLIQAKFSRSPWPVKQRLRGAAAKGKTYERAVIKMLTREFEPLKVQSNRWIKFSDNSGTGFASPDAFVLEGDLIHLFEVKLTNHPVAEMQLLKLYKPLLESLYPGKKVRPIVVFKNHSSAVGDAFASDFTEALYGLALPGEIINWNWLPR